MNIEDARLLVSNTFGSTYNEESLRDLIRNTFERIEFLHENPITGAYIKEGFREHILSYKRIAKYYDKNGKSIDVLSVCVQTTNKLERARTMQRNFISWYLNGGRGGELKDAALVAFYSHDNSCSDWRFSLVKMDYSYDNEKNKIFREFTPARRFSFLVGGSEQIHTVCKQFLPLLLQGGNPTLEQLEETFNIEIVSDEFFEKYKELFLRLVDSVDAIRKKDSYINSDFVLRSLSTSLFCKKLLGQIVFLYFLQRKGWLGVSKDKKWGEGDKHFLRSIFEQAKSNGKNYFNDYLEHFFYEALAMKRESDYFPLLDCKVPFLNGGLFEPASGYDWENFDILIPNEIFSNMNKTTEGDIGDGILDIFDRYNFTVREDEALEKEVAVDPEMLGKVFESLLEVNDRKSKGAFYTPREIVHYMCQESLIDFLYNKINKVAEDTDERRISKDDIAIFIHYGDLLREHEKIVESKANTSYMAKMPIAIKTYAKEIDEALENIFVCDSAIGSGAFPVGMMNEIVRARLNLLESGYIKDKRIRNAYTYKRQAIQKSIYGTDIDSGAVEIAKLRFWLSLIVDEESIDEIKPLPNLDYKIVCANSLLKIDKENLFNRQSLAKLEELKEQFYGETSKFDKRTLKRNINTILKDFANEGDFDFNIFFSEVFRRNQGFDIVIGNPPYGLLNKKQNQNFAIQVTDKLLKYYKTDIEYSEIIYRMLNIYQLFIIRSLNILTDGGIFCDIFPLAFTGDISAYKLRQKIIKEYDLKRIEAFPERDDPNKRVFKHAKMSVCIAIIHKQKRTQEGFYLRINDNKYVQTEKPETYVKFHEIESIDRKFSTIPLLPQKEKDLLAKIYQNSNPLEMVAKCCTGEVDISLDKKYIVDSDDGAYTLLKGAMIDKYLIKYSNISQGSIQFLDKSFVREISGDKLKKLTSPRIVMQAITGINEKIRLKMTITPSGLFCANSVNYILLKNDKINQFYLLGLLNSSLLNYVFKKCSTNSNVNGYEIDNLPIANATPEMHDKIANLTEKLFLEKQKDKNYDISILQQELNKLVYTLYGLSDSEQKIIELS